METQLDEFFAKVPAQQGAIDIYMPNMTWQAVAHQHLPVGTGGSCRSGVFGLTWNGADYSECRLRRQFTNRDKLCYRGIFVMCCVMTCGARMPNQCGML